MDVHEAFFLFGNSKSRVDPFYERLTAVSIRINGTSRAGSSIVRHPNATDLNENILFPRDDDSSNQLHVPEKAVQ